MQVLLQLIGKLWFILIGFNSVLYLYSAFKIKKNRSLNLLALYLVLIFLNQLVADYVADLTGNNLFLFHVYLIIQFLCLSFFYKSLFNKKQKKVVNLLLVIVLIALIVYYIVWPDDFVYFNLPEILIATIPVLGYIMVHLYNSLTEKGDYLLVSGGLLVYLSISSLIFLLYALFTNNIDKNILSDETAFNISEINRISYLLLHVVIFLEWKFNISKWRRKTV
ncbi:hypothetical protein ULMS_12750 [Patiriisocius marinistellae]|uniref:YhhN-like protein n=1 Tax=Patiriisocius marinistellae TaxID=2494560 RepID=A0A5J4FTG3_9FLAO|nr:hypothetical protein [Patiriisocius marinistellae]GEQ85767.1 hypothetical protein ULMS_12750 [Patiriisocius marinistellae]